MPASEEWRVEANLDDPEHGHPLSERIRSRHLDDAARDRLADRVIVTRDGARVFLYAGSEAAAREAERVVRELIAEDELTAEVTLTRWHPVEEAWRDASVPLPRTEDEVDAERERKLVAETAEAAEEGDFDWEVRVEVEHFGDAGDLADRLTAEGLPVTRRWRYVLVGALTEEQANELAARVRAEAPAGTKTSVEPRLSEPTHPLFVFLESR